MRLHPQSLHVCERKKVEEGDRERQRSARHETTMTRETAIQRGEGARYWRESCGLESGDSSLRRRGSDVCGQPVPARLRARARSSAGRSSPCCAISAPDRTAAPRATASRPTCGPRVAGSDLVRDIKKTSMSAAYPPRETRRTSRPRARTGLHPTQTYMTIIDI